VDLYEITVVVMVSEEYVTRDFALKMEAMMSWRQERKITEIIT
jgi:hypothetical protein